MARRKHSLTRWLRGSIEFQIDDDFPIRLLATGVVHSHPPTHRAHMGSIPSRFMVGTISFVQTALADVLRQELADPEEALRAATAWNKMLMVQPDILLAGYLTETPTEPQEISAKEGGAARASPNGTAAATTLAARIAMALRFIS